jgi:hypothetical protein
MSENKVISGPLGTTQMGALVAATVVSFSCLCKGERPNRGPMSNLLTAPR